MKKISYFLVILWMPFIALATRTENFSYYGNTGDPLLVNSMAQDNFPWWGPIEILAIFVIIFIVYKLWKSQQKKPEAFRLILNNVF